VGVLGANTFFRRGSLGASVFVACTVLFIVLPLGWAVSPRVLRLFASAQPPPSTHDRQQDPHPTWQTGRQNQPSSDGRL
jgi:hypothetical protein